MEQNQKQCRDYDEGISLLGFCSGGYDRSRLEKRL